MSTTSDVIGSPQRSLPDIFPYNAETLSASWQETLVLPQNSPFAQSLRKLQKKLGCFMSEMKLVPVRGGMALVLLWKHCRTDGR